MQQALTMSLSEPLAVVMAWHYACSPFSTSPDLATCVGHLWLRSSACFSYLKCAFMHVLAHLLKNSLWLPIC